MEPAHGQDPILPDGDPGDPAGRTQIAAGQIGNLPSVFLDSQGRILALEVKNSGGSVFANVGLLDEAVAAPRSPGGASGAGDDARTQGDALQVFYNPDTQEMRVAPASANSDGTLSPGLAVSS